MLGLGAWCTPACIYESFLAGYQMAALSSRKEGRGLVNAGTHQSLISLTRIKQTLIYGLRVCVINSNERRRESWGHFYDPLLLSFLI